MGQNKNLRISNNHTPPQHPRRQERIYYYQITSRLHLRVILVQVRRHRWSPDDPNLDHVFLDHNEKRYHRQRETTDLKRKPEYTTEHGRSDWWGRNRFGRQRFRWRSCRSLAGWP